MTVIEDERVRTMIDKVSLSLSIDQGLIQLELRNIEKESNSKRKRVREIERERDRERRAKLEERVTSSQ